MQQNSLGYTLHQLVFIIDHQSDEALHRELGVGFSQFKILMAKGLSLDSRTREDHNVP